MSGFDNLCVPAAAALLALLIDWLWGEPPARCHPVVGMGWLLGQFTQRWLFRLKSRTWAFGMGALAWLLGAGCVVGLSAALQLGLAVTSAWPGGAWGAGLQALLVALLLKPLFAWRMLHDEVRAVESALNESLEQGRQRLSWLCSRDVTRLDATQVRETALETLAENLNDSVVAPLFWFAVAGLPGAALYRWANTADAMWGYRGMRQGRDWTWAGKWAARADDVLSWLPARLTGLLLWLWGGMALRETHWRNWFQQARIIPSPNGGWPMAAMALSLDVRLGKPGVYTLHPFGRTVVSSDTHRALRLAAMAVCSVALMAGFGFWWGVRYWGLHL